MLRIAPGQQESSWNMFESMMPIAQSLSDQKGGMRGSHGGDLSLEKSSIPF